MLICSFVTVISEGNLPEGDGPRLSWFIPLCAEAVRLQSSPVIQVSTDQNTSTTQIVGT